MKVFFFGAGASKACGLLLTSELLPALFSPVTFGIDVRRSKYQEVVNQFDKDLTLSTLFAKWIHDTRGPHQLGY